MQRCQWLTSNRPLEGPPGARLRCSTAACRGGSSGGDVAGAGWWRHRQPLWALPHMPSSPDVSPRASRGGAAEGQGQNRNEIPKATAREGGRVRRRGWVRAAGVRAGAAPAAASAVPRPPLGMAVAAGTVTSW